MKYYISGAQDSSTGEPCVGVYAEDDNGVECFIAAFPDEEEAEEYKAHLESGELPCPRL